jgi:futalosine hydrolase
VRILLAAATQGEVAGIAGRLSPLWTAAGPVRTYRCGAHEVDVLVTGVGMIATAAWCSRALTSARYGLALNAGLCGSFRPQLALGDVVHVVSDGLPELGAEDGDSFLNVHQLQLLGEDDPPFTGGRLVNVRPPRNPALEQLSAVAGITVNTVHGRESTIDDVRRRLNPDVESMEGAAFMYCCLIHEVPFAQVRAVSNVVERRNRDAWRVPEALARLRDAAVAIVEGA